MRSFPIRPFNDVSDVLNPTLSLFTENFWLITKIAIVINAPFEIFRTLNFHEIKNDPQLTFGTFVLELLCGVLIAPALIYALMHVMETGTAPGINESYRWGFSKFGKLIVCAGLAFILQAFGLLLCIVPGIVVAMSLVLVYPLAVLEQLSPARALRNSYELTQGHRGKIFGASVVIWLLMLMGSVPEFIVDSLATENAVLWPIHVLASILTDTMQQMTTILALVTYLSIRALWSQNAQ